jgi:hypothetical protein
VGRLVAIRGAGSNAPASAVGHDVHPAWPSVEDVQEKEEPREEKVSEAEGNAPQQRADPFPFATPRISKSAGPRVDSPTIPLSARQVSQQEHAAYSMPSRPNRQLTKIDLETYDFRSLNAIEAVANSAPYLGNEVLRNELILDTELRTNNVLTHFFIERGVAELQPGLNLLRDERAWERVSNTVFFNAIRMAWNNFSLLWMPNQMGPPSAKPTVRTHSGEATQQRMTHGNRIKRFAKLKLLLTIALRIN